MRVSYRNRMFTHADGRTMMLREWARVLGVSEETLIIRVKKGWSNDDILQKRNGRGGRARGRSIDYNKPVTPKTDALTPFRHGAW